MIMFPVTRYICMYIQYSDSIGSLCCNKSMRFTYCLPYSVIYFCHRSFQSYPAVSFLPDGNNRIRHKLIITSLTIQSRTPSLANPVLMPLVLNLLLSTVSFRSPIIADRGNSTGGQEPRRLGFCIIQTSFSVTGVEYETGPKTGMVELARLITLPRMDLTSLSSN